MEQQTRDIVEARNLVDAVIIDDAYDPPTARNIAEQGQAFLNELKSDADYAVVAKILGRASLDEDELVECLDDDATVQALYAARDQLPNQSARRLFGAFDDEQRAKLAELEPIVELLESLNIRVTKRGTAEAIADPPPGLVIVDLFLDDAQEDGAAAAEQAAHILGPYLPTDDDTPAPLVVLISSREPHLRAMNEHFRERANVPGCRFLFITKRDFREQADETLYRLYQLFVHADNSAVFDCFTRQIETSAGRANDRFVRLLRKFELSDYVDLIDLAVQAEGIPLRQYVLDLIALSWASFAESDTRLADALQRLDALPLSVDQYPPNAFEPSDAVLNLYEHALYRQASALPKLESFNDLGLGDILQSPGDGHALPRLQLVIVQDCDLLRGDPPDAAFMIEGEVSAEPIFRDLRRRVFPYPLDPGRLAVVWDIKRWRTVRPTEFATWVQEQHVERRFRLRPPWSLTCQSQFFQNLARPAEMAVPHAVHGVDLQVLLKQANGQAQLVVDFDGSTKGFLLVGRRGNDPVTRLVMSSAFAEHLRVALRETLVARNDPDDATASWLRDVLGKPAKLQALRGQLELRPGGRKHQVGILDGAGVASEATRYWSAPDNPGGDYHLVINVSVLDSRENDVAN